VDEEGYLTVPTHDPKNPLQIESYVWMDSELAVFVVTDDFLGTAHGTTTGMKGGNTVELPSFLAQRMHTTSYGGVDRIGRGSKTYGITFTLVHWFKHMIATTIYLNTHAMWILAQYDVKVNLYDPLLDDFRASTTEGGGNSSSRGIAARRKFYLKLVDNGRHRPRCGEDHG